MQTYIPQPPSLKGDERAQLEQMYRYLYKMSEQLNTALAVTDKEYQIVVQTKSGSAPGSESPITPQLDAQYRELRSLIIKTADIVNQQMDKTIKQLNGKYEAISSEWGTFEQNIERKIVETAEATIDSFDYSEKIHGIEKTVLNGVTSYAIESLGYIKRGIIGFDDENFPIYGIAVGTELKEKTVEKDGKTYQQIDTTKRIATYTSDAITFWRNDVAIARFSGDELYVTRAEITQQIRLGDWFFSVSESGGLNISKRLGSAIDISENGTITSLVGDIDEANTSISQTQNDITALAKRTSAAEDKISSTESKLELKADSATLNVVQETVDGLSGRVSTAESKLELKADSATLSVTETNLKKYTNNAVDGIAVGGRNYILESGEYDPITGNGGAAQDYYIFKIADAFWSNDERIDSNIVFSFDWEWNTGLPGAMNSLIGFRASPYYNASFQFPAGQKTGHVSLSINIPTLNYTATHLFIRLVNVSSSYNLTIRNAKLEVGNKATDWSPAPEDPASSLSVNSEYSKVEITKNQVKIVSREMEVAVPSEDGEDDVLRVDADGVHAEVVEADVIVSESVVRTQGAASYTPANAGELAAILTELSGKTLTGAVVINCTNITGGTVALSGIQTAGGRLEIYHGTFGGVTITDCQAFVYFYGSIVENANLCIGIYRSQYVYFHAVKISGDLGLQLGYESNSDGVLGGNVIMISCTGNCYSLARLGYCSVLRVMGNSKPSGILQCAAGSEVYNATPDPTFAVASSQSIPTTQTATVSLSPTSTSTSGYGSKLYQGRYSSSQSLRKGVMLFTLPSDLTSASNIDSATLTIRRIGGVGQGGGVSVQVRCYDVPGTLYASKTAYDGQTVSIDVTSAVKAMKTSGYTGLMLYNPDTTTAGSKPYTASYARFAGKGESGEPVLKISYRK